MDYIIDQKDMIRLAGTAKKFRKNEAEVEIDRFWNEVKNNGALNTIHQVKTRGEHFDAQIVAVWKQNEVDPEQIIYFIGTEYDISNSIYALELMTIPPQTWAIFRDAGEIPNDMNDVKHKIFNEIMPLSEYKVNGDLHLEVYADENKNKEDYRFEIWVAIEA